MKFIQKLKSIVLWLWAETGIIPPPSSPTPDHKAAVQPVAPAKAVEPDDDGWYREPWGKWRPVKGGMGSEMLEDDYPQSRSLTKNNPFKDYKP